MAEAQVRAPDADKASEPASGNEGVAFARGVMFATGPALLMWAVIATVAWILLGQPG